MDKWNKAVDICQVFGTIITTDLSKAFACLNHDLLIAKLHSCGISLSSCRRSFWHDIEYVVPQWSSLGLFPFNIFLCDLFLVLDNMYFAGFTDCNIPYTVKKKQTSKVAKSLEENSKPLIEWLKDNKMNLNLDKCHLTFN